MQIPQVTAQPTSAEPKAVDGDQPRRWRGEQGAFAILLALLQGSVAAQSEPAPLGTGPASGEQADSAGSPSPSASAPGPAGPQATSLIAVNGATQGDAAGVGVGVSPESLKPAPEQTAGMTASTKQGSEPAHAAPTEPESAPMATVPEGTAKSAPAKPLVVTEVETPPNAGKPAQTSSAQFAVQRANADQSVQVGSANAAALAEPAHAASSNPAAETGIPVAVIAEDDASDPGAEAKKIPPANGGIDSKDRSAAPQSSARFVVEKPGPAVAESSKPKAELASKPEQATGQVSPRAASEVADSQAETMALRKAVERDPAGSTGTGASRSDGVQPVKAEAPQTALVQVEPTVQRAERSKSEPEPATAPDRTTVKTIVVDTVKGVRYLLTKGEQTMRIRLVPESLGELRLVVTSTSDEISVRLASASHTVRELMHTQVHQLREALTQDGATVGKITIAADTSAGAGTGNPQTGSPDRAWNPNAREWTGNMAHAPKYSLASGQQPSVVPRNSAPHPGALNLFA